MQTRAYVIQMQHVYRDQIMYLNVCADKDLVVMDIVVLLKVISLNNTNPMLNSFYGVFWHFLGACRSHEECGPYGQCAIDASGYAYYCKCREGFEGSGGTDCRPSADAGCDVVRNCDSNADCRPNYEGKYVCQCRAGFQGDGTSCQEDMLSCRVLNNCSPNGNCEFDERARGYRCSCKEVRASLIY